MLNWWVHRDWLQLAEDGLCANTECAIRATDECPVFRVIHWGKHRDMDTNTWKTYGMDIKALVVDNIDIEWKVESNTEKQRAIEEITIWMSEWFAALDFPIPRWLDITLEDTLRILNSLRVK